MRVDFYIPAPSARRKDDYYVLPVDMDAVPATGDIVLVSGRQFTVKERIWKINEQNRYVTLTLAEVE